MANHRKTKCDQDMARDAVARIQQWAEIIGIGYHPDNSAASYYPPIEDPELYDEDHYFAFQVLGDEVYTVALNFTLDTMTQDVIDDCQATWDHGIEDEFLSDPENIDWDDEPNTYFGS